MTNYTEPLTEGETVSFTMVTDSGVERDGEMVVTEIEGNRTAWLENADGQEFQFLFSGMGHDEVAQIRVNGTQYIGNAVEMEGY
jgi:hypothetical protein